MFDKKKSNTYFTIQGFCSASESLSVPPRKFYNDKKLGMRKMK